MASPHRIENGRRIEWAVGLASAALVTGLILYLAYEALFSASRPPIFSVEITAIERQPDGFHVTFDLSNEGDKTASAVEVSARLEGGPDAERQSAQFDYVPGGSKREGTFLFTAEPTRENLRIAVESHVKP